MFRVLGCITQDHDLRLVVLAGVLCLFACSTAMSLVGRARASDGRTRTLWVAGAGFVAGCGIWATHFVAMLAYQARFPLDYDIALTILSVVIAIALCGAGFALAVMGSSAVPRRRAHGLRDRHRCTMSAWPRCARRRGRSGISAMSRSRSSSASLAMAFGMRACHARQGLQGLHASAR